MENDKSDLINFYDARDFFIGQGNHGEEQHLSEGMRRLRACRHEEARYVCSLFPDGSPPDSREEVKQVFLAQGEHSIALCYAGLVNEWNEALVRRAAEMGHPYAQGQMSKLSFGEERLEWAQRAARNRDRDGLWRLGWCFQKGIGVTEDRIKAVTAYKESANLGSKMGMRCYAMIAFEKNDSQRYLWLGKSAQPFQFLYVEFIHEIMHHMYMHRVGLGCKLVLLMIGKMLKGHVDKERQTLFGTLWMQDYVNSACDVLTLYDDCIKSATEATMTWMMVAKRLRIYHDVARLIGKKVWENKSDFIRPFYSVVLIKESALK